jgi:hypothetical protein
MKAVQAWITIVFILFALVELFQWVKGFILPLPIYVFAGAFLAIASNYDKGISSLFRQRIKSEGNLSQTATLVETIDNLDAEKIDRSSLPASDE